MTEIPLEKLSNPAFIQNVRKPVGKDGELIVERMNSGGHAELAEWGFSHLEPSSGISALDVGCGGGANLARALRLFPESTVCGLDYSEVSVAKSLEVNAEAVAAGTCSVVLGDAGALPFPDASFDLVTAFETVFFWPDIAEAFAEVRRVLKPGGTFLVCNESDGRDKEGRKWADIIEGLTLLTEEDLRALLKAAGFTDVDTDSPDDKPWLAVVARKA